MHLRERGKALEYLNRGLQEHCGLKDLKADPLYDSLHDDTGFKKLIAKLGL
jgi:hypothetical protein